MALLVATAGGASRSPQVKDGPADAAARISPGPGLLWSADGGGTARQSTPTTTSTTAAATTTTAPRLPSGSGPGTADIAATHVTSGSASAGSSPAESAPSATTTTTTPAPATTTTTGASAAVPADRTQTQGYLNPPTEPSNKFGFTGTGAMEVSVVWSGSTYLTMQVSCPSGGQSVGGTAAMAASLPDASGSCLATVSEPTSETTSLTYTISIGPAGG
jgi:hypothetical protein